MQDNNNNKKFKQKNICEVTFYKNYNIGYGQKYIDKFNQFIIKLKS